MAASAVLGELLADFGALDRLAQPRRLSDLRGDRNLVLLFMGAGSDPGAERLLAELTAAGDFLDESDCIVVTVTAGAPPSDPDNLPESRWHWYDPDGKAHRRIGALGSGGEPSPRVFVADRDQTAFLVQQAGQPLPALQQILRQVQYVSMLCPG